MKSQSKNLKKKRLRKAQYRNWSYQEQELLIKYLGANLPIEKPNAKVYYKRFLQQSKMQHRWTVVRRKVKKMLQSYVEAKNWMVGAVGGTVEDDESFERDIRRKICPFFEILDPVFEHEKFISNVLINDKEYRPAGAVVKNLNDSPGATRLDTFLSSLPSTSHSLIDSTITSTDSDSRTNMSDSLGSTSNNVALSKEKCEMEKEQLQVEMNLIKLENAELEFSKATLKLLMQRLVIERQNFLYWMEVQMNELNLDALTRMAQIEDLERATLQRIKDKTEEEIAGIYSAFQL